MREELWKVRSLQSPGKWWGDPGPKQVMETVRKEGMQTILQRLPFGVMECYVTQTAPSTKNNPKRGIRDANILKTSGSWRNSKEHTSKKLRESGNPQKGRQKTRVAKPLFPEGICQSRYTGAWFWWLWTVCAINKTLIPAMMRHFTGYPAHINLGVPTAYISISVCVRAPTLPLLALGDKIRATLALSKTGRQQTNKTCPCKAMTFFFFFLHIFSLNLIAWLVLGPSLAELDSR